MTVLNWLLTNLNQQNKIESAVNLECEMQFYVLCLIGYSRLLIIQGNSDQDHLFAQENSNNLEVKDKIVNNL